MSIVRNVPRTCRALVFTVATAAFATPLGAQDHDMSQMAGMDMSGHEMSDLAREGSGTAWLPDETPMYAMHTMKGPWTLMFHENAFLQFFHESGARGDDQMGSINWAMGMA